MEEKVLFGKTLAPAEYVPDKYKIKDPVILFRSSSDSSRIFAVSKETLFSHILLLGGTGCGKTNTLMQACVNLKGWEKAYESVYLIFDTKNDYQTHKAFFNPDTDLIIGNSKNYRDRSVIWNIFEEVMADGDDPKDYESNAYEIAKGLFNGRGSATQPFFVESATTLFANTIIYFIRRYRDNYNAWKNNLNNKKLALFLTGNSAQNLIKYFSIYEDMRGLKSYIGDGNNNQALGVLAELRSMLDACFRGVFAEEPPAGEKGFSMRKAIREKGGRSIFIEYDLSTGESLTPVYSVLVDLALKEALSEKTTGNTFLLLDELKLLPKLSHLDDAINFGRSKNVSVIAGLQSVNQMYSAYGEKHGQVIIGGFGSVFAFKTHDHESREYISKLFGPNITSYRYYDINNKPVDRERDGNVVEHWDIQSLETGQAYIGLVSEKRPFLFDFEYDPFK